MVVHNPSIRPAISWKGVGIGGGTLTLPPIIMVQWKIDENLETSHTSSVCPHFPLKAMALKKHPLKAMALNRYMADDGFRDTQVVRLVLVNRWSFLGTKGQKLPSYTRIFQEMIYIYIRIPIVNQLESTWICTLLQVQGVLSFYLPTWWSFWSPGDKMMFFQDERKSHPQQRQVAKMGEENCEVFQGFCQVNGKLYIILLLLVEIIKFYSSLQK